VYKPWTSRSGGINQTGLLGTSMARDEESNGGHITLVESLCGCTEFEFGNDHGIIDLFFLELVLFLVSRMVDPITLS
jgi:hypothetical protein